jgi:Family of unknown function (DUF5686)
VENMYQKVDFYQNAVNLLTVDFISPLATIGPAIYHYYIEDTTLIGHTRCVHLFFSPRQKTDLAFQGDLWIALDATYSLRKIEVQIPEQINLNWVNGLQIRQEFERLTTAAGSALMPVRDEVLMEFGVVKDKNTKTILARRSVSYQNASINRPLPDSLFAALNVLQRDPKADRRDEVYWTAKRPDTLARREQGVYKMVDSLNRNRPFRRFMNTMRVLADGYYSEGGFDFGPFNTYLGYNPIEGFRLRAGGRTNPKFSKRLLLEGYAARGFQDRRTKGMAGIRYSFGGPVMKYPLNQLRVWYLNDLQIPGRPDLQNGLVQSVGRGDNNRMLYNRSVTAEYLREFKSGFSWSAAFKNSEMSPAGVLEFNRLSPDGTAPQTRIQNTEAGLMLRYAPNEKFYQSPDYRTQIFTRHPIFTLSYAAGLRGVLGGQYDYHALRFKAAKGFYFSPLGWSEAYVEAGRLFGRVPYPLLTVHQGNQTYIYQREAYNLMNFLEFVSDRYATVNITHNFGGFFFNRLPLIRRLKLREIVTFKALWGGLDAQNRPSFENGLLLFPTDAQGRTLTYTLEKQPYVEASVGISNIFKFLRIDLVRRFNYLDHPGVARVAIRGKFQMEF